MSRCSLGLDIYSLYFNIRVRDAVLINYILGGFAIYPLRRIIANVSSL